MRSRPPGMSMSHWGPLLAGTSFLGLAACGTGGPGDPPGTGLVEVPSVCASVKKPEVRGLSQCGPLREFIPINRYQGEFSDVVQDREDAVVLIDGRCTGTLIEASAGPVVVTAGHCARLGDRALLVFNFEEAPDGDPLVTEGTVIEQSLEPDYALIQLDVLPAVRPVLLTTRPTERLAIIQHPRGLPKVIAEGRFVASCDRQLYYSDLDTLVGSSGAGVLNRQGYLLGIHTDGDCDSFGRGTNRGWTLESIVEASSYLQRDDIAER
ncbi:trypsin-like serine peptidase [Corallococcus silvisoli]|uniref:trypsin-like serine peptidase n=1 Tax=Corallococcus silvisoli TaxID=2697031 RepID=UPI001377415E|nr:serine protease [Corallococcus silvisoli]